MISNRVRSGLRKGSDVGPFLDWVLVSLDWFLRLTSRYRQHVHALSALTLLFCAVISATQQNWSAFAFDVAFLWINLYALEPEFDQPTRRRASHPSTRK